MNDEWIEGFPPRGNPSQACPRVLAPKWPSVYVVALLSERLFQRIMHFDATVRRTAPCTRKPDCPFCPDPALRPVGYLAAQAAKPRKLWTLQLSDAAMGDLAAIREAHGALRGLVVETGREDRRDTARQYVRYVDRVPEDLLFPEYDPRPGLKRLWGWTLAGLEERFNKREDAPEPKRRAKR